MSRYGRVGLSLVVGAFFFLWHAPLLSEAGVVRGFNSDAAIIALMGRKMLEGRGFDFFFWGQNYIGPLTSIFIAAAGAFLGGVDALALRAGTLAEVLLGILLMGWSVSRIDTRAAVATMLALAITPPVILRMMITPLGAEMAFVMAAALLALLVADSPRPLVIGVVAGIGWWMNQQVVFTLLAGAIVLAFRSSYVRLAVRELRPLDRWRFNAGALGWKRVPGAVHALAWVLTRAGLVLFILFVAFDVAKMHGMPFVFGQGIDALLLLVLPFVMMPLIFGEWRRWHLPPRHELAPVARFAAGFALGYAPVWLGAILGWYERSYVFAFALNQPSEVVEQIRGVGAVVAHWIGLASGPAGFAYLLAFALFVALGLANARSEKRILLALVPLGNLAFYLLASGGKPHYLIASVGMLFALAALGALDLWDRGRRVLRALVAAGAIAATVSLALSAHGMHRALLAEADPLPLLARVEAMGCEVCYADFWVAYRYRLLDRERRAWIPYLSQNRTRAESYAMQRLPGQRCVISDDGTVTAIAHDLPIVHAPRARR